MKMLETKEDQARLKIFTDLEETMDAILDRCSCTYVEGFDLALKIVAIQEQKKLNRLLESILKKHDK